MPKEISIFSYVIDRNIHKRMETMSIAKHLIPLDSKQEVNRNLDLKIKRNEIKNFIVVVTQSQNKYVHSRH